MDKSGGGQRSPDMENEFYTMGPVLPNGRTYKNDLESSGQRKDMKKLPRIYDVDDNMRLQKIAKKAASKDKAGLQYGQHPELK